MLLPEDNETQIGIHFSVMKVEQHDGWDQAGNQIIGKACDIKITLGLIIISTFFSLPYINYK